MAACRKFARITAMDICDADVQTFQGTTSCPWDSRQSAFKIEAGRHCNVQNVGRSKSLSSLYKKNLDTEFILDLPEATFI